MQQPLVSIIIPVYNSAHLLVAAITAVQKQTYSNKEIIIVDDASTDNTYALGKSYESESCKVIRQKNAGAAIARNTGLLHASGKYIQFLDVDDFLSVNKIEEQVKALQGNFNKVAVCNYIEFFNDSELQQPVIKDQSAFIYSSDSPVDYLINLYGGNGQANFVQTNSWLTPRHLIDKAGGWRAYRCPDDDGEFFARVLLESDGIVYVPGVYNYYRRSASIVNLSNRVGKKYIQNSLLSIDLKYRYLNQFTESTSLKKAMALQYLRFAVATFPRHIILSAIALKKYKALKVKASLPKLGGSLVEAVKNMLGWKTARIIRYYLRERNL
jgi:glycosyltransferase involved in cell wall biosynthesis